MPTEYGTSAEVRIRIGGPAGAGIKAAGQTLARSFVAAGLNTFDLTEYPSLIKGGHNTYHLRISPDQLYSHVTPTDVLVALDRATVDLHLAEFTEGGAIVYDPAAVDAGDLAATAGHCPVPVPLAEIVKTAGGAPVMRNVAALGAVLGHLDFPLAYLVDSLRAQFAHKAPEVAEQNAAIATAAYEHAQQAHCAFPVRLAPVDGAPERVLADGVPTYADGLPQLAGGPIWRHAAAPRDVSDLMRRL